MAKPTGRGPVGIGIDRARCKGCGLCIELCARGVFRSDAGMPVVAHQERCTACGNCELICPDFAIDLEVDR
ncbi:MAG TPA: 4Fe-4S binding protein [Dehalococcoidia bacterium]|jgi:2-oxoglutarate ferredoxin oxidoreductase subunit delta|nr:4Fe-4S binding protein [Dehalococcoidia bacterium]